MNTPNPNDICECGHPYSLHGHQGCLKVASGQQNTYCPCLQFHPKQSDLGKEGQPLPDRICPKCNYLAVIHDGYCGKCREITLSPRKFEQPTPPKISEDEIETLAKTLLFDVNEISWGNASEKTKGLYTKIASRCLEQTAQLLAQNDKINLIRDSLVDENLRMEDGINDLQKENAALSEQISQFKSENERLTRENFLLDLLFKREVKIRQAAHLSLAQKDEALFASKLEFILQGHGHGVDHKNCKSCEAIVLIGKALSTPASAILKQFERYKTTLEVISKSRKTVVNYNTPTPEAIMAQIALNPINEGEK